MAVSFYSGLDLGKQSDHAAFVLNEPDCTNWPPIHRIRTVKLWELGTKYETIQNELREMCAARKLTVNHMMAVEVNGPGVPVVEKMMDIMPCEVQPIFTAGGAGITNGPDDVLHVSKGQVLVSTIQAVLGENRLRIAPVYWRDELYRQLEVFGVKISKAGNEQFEAIGEAHDDMVMALALALFISEHFAGMGRQRMEMVPADIMPAEKTARALGSVASLRQPAHQNEWAKLAGPLQAGADISRAIFGPGGRPTTRDRMPFGRFRRG